MAGTTDMAALAAGVVAIAVSVIGVPGRYDLMDLVIGLALLLIFAGYVMDNERRPLQSAAVAAVVALAVLPVFGFVFERAISRLMNNWWHGAVWLVAAALVFAFDRRLQTVPTRSTGSGAASGGECRQAGPRASDADAGFHGRSIDLPTRSVERPDQVCFANLADMGLDAVPPAEGAVVGAVGAAPKHRLLPPSPG